MGAGKRRCNEVFIDGREVEEKVRLRKRRRRVLALKGQYSKKTKIWMFEETQQTNE